MKTTKQFLIIENQGDEETICRTELNERLGITKGKDFMFMAFLHIFHRHYINHNSNDTLAGLAQSIYEQKIFFVIENGKIKRMRMNSILANLNRLSKQVQEEIELEKERKERYKSRR